MQKVLNVCRIATAAALALAIILIAGQCLDIYKTGLTPDGSVQPVYTREDVAARLRALSVPLLLCASVAVITIVLHAASGRPSAQRDAISPENRLRLMKAGMEELPLAARKEERMRRRMILGLTLCLAVGTVYSLGCLLDPGAFPSWTLTGTETVIKGLILRTAPVVAAMFLLGIAVSFALKASVEREIVLLRDVPKTAARPVGRSRSCPVFVRVILYVAAVVFILLGVMNGGARDVLYKAVNICTECIGLG